MKWSSWTSLARRGTPVSAQITVLGGKALYIILLPLEMLCNLGGWIQPCAGDFFQGTTAARQEYTWTEIVASIPHAGEQDLNDNNNSERISVSCNPLKRNILMLDYFVEKLKLFWIFRSKSGVHRRCQLMSGGLFSGGNQLKPNQYIPWLFIPK